MNWNLMTQLGTIVILKAIASSLFLMYSSQIFYTPVLREEPTSITKGCSVSWSFFNGKCYYFSTRSQTWDESLVTCAEFDSHLAVVNGKEELMFLKNRTQHERHFIITSQRDAEFDSSPRSFSCVVVGFNSVDSASCTTRHRCICEKNA
uniref:C-type lectin domain family 5 member A-like n=1 Tax=Euleptes europaea TaxID=460621 RepID=UPI00254074A9|nr:C-type lectin domain family 5 member A-like [Euleptes europaea]